MARIWLKQTAGGYRITVMGQLAARDLRRLERACGPALEQRTMSLHLDLSRLTGADAAAEAFLARLRECGARIVDRQAESRS